MTVGLHLCRAEMQYLYLDARARAVKCHPGGEGASGALNRRFSAQHCLCCGCVFTFLQAVVVTLFEFPLVPLVNLGPCSGSPWFPL